MNEKHLENAIKRIERDLKTKNNRIRKQFGVSLQQLEMVERIISVRRIISSIPSDISLAVFGNGLDIEYLLRLTDLYRKDIRFFIDDGNSTIVRDIYHDNHEYEIRRSDDNDILKTSCIIIANMDEADVFERKLTNKNYQGKVINIYGDEVESVFHHLYVRGLIMCWQDRLMTMNYPLWTELTASMRNLWSAVTER